MTEAPVFDSALLAGIRQQNPRAVNRLRHHALPAMSRLFERSGVDPTQAEWLAQDVFVDFVYRWAERVDEPRAIERYLRAMCLTALRRMARVQHRHLPLLAHEGADHEQEARLHDALDAERLEPCIDTLTPRTRQRLQQHYHQGLTMAAVARSEGVSAPAVRKSITKALDALRRCLGVDA